MQSTEAVTIRTDDADLQILAEGGSLARYRFLMRDGAFDLMRPYPVDAPVEFDPRRAACFPMVPYFSRIRDGRFRFDGKTHQLRLNFGDHPHSVHGVGWQTTWRIEGSDEHRAALVLDYPGDDWPYPFQARLIYALEGADLTQEISVTNMSDGAMPIGLGIHPFFPRHGGATLRADVGSVWLYGDDFLPTECIPCPPKWDLRTAKDVASMNCDTVFENWDRRAEIVWPNDGVSLTMAADEGLDRLVVFAPSSGDIFCVEPVSQITDAFNKAADGMPAEETGMRILAPGETWTVSARFRPKLI